jgi:ethanolamine-phosphate cytidylyltransferase
VLVTGVNCDEGIAEVKGPTILNDEERCMIIESCKFVTEVAPKTPYSVTEEILDSLDCKYYVHGDDPCVGSDGTDMCDNLAKKGRFKQFKRTPGVSTTDITAKLLKLTSGNF